MSNPGNILINGIISGTSGSVISLQLSAGTINKIVISPANIFFPIQASSPPTYQKGGVYFDLTSGKLAIGGASAWEMLNSSV